MSRHETRERGTEFRKLPFARVTWKARAGYLVGGVLFLLFWLANTRGGKFAWLNHLHQPMFTPMFFILGLVFIGLGVAPWNWLNRRSERGRTQTPGSHRR